MKIYRDFITLKNGEGTCRVEISLSDKELDDAFNECRHERDLNGVDDFLRVYRDGWQTLNAEETEALAKLYREYEETMIEEGWYENMYRAFGEIMKRRNEA